MNLLLFGLVVLAIFLFGVFVMAIVIDAKHGDDCCTYKLYAVRDRLVSAVVFHNVSRGDPWFNSLYENVNSLLIHSHFLAGPKKWDTAAKVGKFLASHPHKGKRLREVPSYEPPREIAEILPELESALQHLMRHHIGLRTQFSAQLREQRRKQREQARQLQSMVHDYSHHRCAAT